MAALVGTGLSGKRIILAALAATLIAAAVVTIVFVILRPAHVRFAVTDAYSQMSGGGDNDGDRTVRLHLAVAANNTSGRAAVMYRSMLVDVSNSTGPHLVNWVRANVSTPMPLLQPPRNVTAVAAEVALVGGFAAEAFAGNGNMTSGFSVTVSASARFKVGVAWTRLYDIKVSCAPVSFFFDEDNGQRQAAGRQVDCSAAA